MNKFEYEINNGKLESRCINAVINDLQKNKTFDAWINAKTLQEIDSKLPAGYEQNRLSTLANYFDPVVVEKWEIEITNSQYIYFTDFTILYEYGFYDYVETLENGNTKKQMRLDRRHRT